MRKNGITGYPLFPILRQAFILTAMDTNGYSTWLEIDLGALANNYKELTRICQTPVMAVIKANAYGHGLEKIAQEVKKAGGDWLGVARFEEGAMLRAAWIETDALVLGYTSPDQSPLAAKDNLSLTVYDAETVNEYSRRVEAQGLTLKVHVKVDSGMNRIGIRPEETVEFLRWLKTLPGIEVEGIFTHFARADEPGQNTTAGQIKIFDDVLSAVDSAGLRPSWVHASNSAGALNFPQARYDMVRCGIALYGLQPSAETHLPESFRPVLAWKTRLILTKKVSPGAGISYGHRYFTSKNELIGTIPVGYADGFRRVPGNVVLVRGIAVPVVGTICMDQTMVQLDAVPDAHIGDEVVIIGQQGSAIRSADQLAEHWGTINYEVICGLSSRLPRLYF